MNRLAMKKQKDNDARCVKQAFGPSEIKGEECPRQSSSSKMNWTYCEPLTTRSNRRGYRTRPATNGQEAIAAIDQDPVPDLVLLDLMLPDTSGTEICRRIKGAERTKNVPVIMVTAKGEEIDRVVGFEVGADDYVVKPYSMRELMLRVGAMLRRFRGTASQKEEITFGCLRLDRPGHRAWVDDTEVRLTALEFRLLTTFYDRKDEFKVERDC